MFITLLFIKKWRNHTKASINFFAVLAMLVVPWVAQGQAINYTCDFDDPSDTAGTACELLDSFPWTENLVYRSFCRIKSSRTLVFTGDFVNQGAWRTF